MHTINEFMSIDTIHLYVETVEEKECHESFCFSKKKDDENLAQFCFYLYFHFISLNIYTLTTKKFHSFNPFTFSFNIIPFFIFVLICIL